MKKEFDLGNLVGWLLIWLLVALVVPFWLLYIYLFERDYAT